MNLFVKEEPTWLLVLGLLPWLQLLVRCASDSPQKSLLVSTTCWRAAYAGRVGMPLVCVGFAASRGALPDILPSSFPFTILLVLVLAAFFSRTYFSFNLQELYTTIVNVVALNLLLYAEEYLRSPMAVVESVGASLRGTLSMTSFTL